MLSEKMSRCLLLKLAKDFSPLNSLLVFVFSLSNVESQLPYSLIFFYSELCGTFSERLWRSLFIWRTGRVNLVQDEGSNKLSNFGHMATSTT